MENKFAYNLKLLRQEEKLNQKQLATLVGVSQQCISEWENGKIEPTMSMLWKLADIFKISVDELIGRVD
ncbi:MAG: helix-turn-helix transcriptional regulator [Clostridia bacterium]|nr:helix-turn-helix transcriptional regulator [Clostridia bacterium]